MPRWLTRTGVAAAGGRTPYGTLFGGVQAGYEHFFASRLMLGIELDASFPDYLDLAQVLSYRASGTGTATEQLEYLASLRGRIGYDLGGWTPFLSGGVAWASTRFFAHRPHHRQRGRQPKQRARGLRAGGGIDHALNARWSARAEYLYTNFGLTGFLFGSAPARYDSQVDLHRSPGRPELQFGEADAKEDKKGDRGPGTWELHGQTAFVFQGYTPFNAPYDGPQSLPASGQSRETWAVSAFLGVRLWPGGEFYYNPELLQGFGVADTTGAGGFPNGEAQRAFPYPRYSTSRLFPAPEHRPGRRASKTWRATSTCSPGNSTSRASRSRPADMPSRTFSTTNSYANDPRVDFLNLVDLGGRCVRLRRRQPGLHLGRCRRAQPAELGAEAGLLPGARLQRHQRLRSQPVRPRQLCRRAGAALRHRLAGPAPCGWGAWLNSAFAGSYNQAVALAAVNPGLSANDTIALTRQGRTKYGFYLNLEQELYDNVGAFARFSWNDGRTEIMSFTDITTSLSAGLSIKGESWGRPKDTIGVGGGPELDLGRLHQLPGGRRYFGILIGDGALSYGSEVVAETYYSLHLAKGLYVTADYQFLANPAYNAVRGPVHVFSGRLMAKF